MAAAGEPDRAPGRATHLALPILRQAARKSLQEEMDRTQLAIYCWVNLEEAAQDLPTTPASEFFDRFLAWTRGPHTR